MINCITISPKHGDIQAITKFINNGCNMFRLNFSWGTHAEYASIIKNIRQASKDQEKPILILQDLQGPKLRVQNLDTEIHVKPTDILKASFDKCPNHIQLQAKGLYNKDAIGKKLLIKDGDIIFTITEVQTNKQIITLESQSHGSFKNMNGCNAPSIELGLQAISTKDKQDIQFAIDQQIDIISLSFIHNANDLIALKKLTQSHAQILAKIETETAVKNIKSILEHADWCMIARGDLGVEVGLTQLGTAQDKILKAATATHIPCLVATEVLKTMLKHKHPSRAESDDIHQCLQKGARGFILTNETVIGDNPFLATQWITKFLDNYLQHK